MFDCFDHYDCVINHDADREDDAEERDVVDRKSEALHRGESADQRNWNRDQRYDCRPPGLEKDKHYQNNKSDGFEKCLLHFVD